MENNQTKTVPAKNIMYKLKDKWGVDSLWQVLAILAVFTLTGSTVVYLRKGLFFMLGYTEETAMWLKVVTYVLFIFPSYQLLILVYGFLFGQFDFFWEKEKKMFSRIKSLFVRKK
ncbi:DUF6787 family protein [Aureibacter tunicatorum]|uniref:DUF6787 domain-containing protein n=1 Tax=Aureibacter tunicatorum TaxID=866807 RepID=A0AAE3XI20_9BACT|nr:DUF6787 family protein [Aureibacter tunicatorum]MDR6237228.1 hypothetical protein [Aureibacter tunicatorum]BDD06220.1 hypothetical protein AUTU_37030 [Aureibacter tunicatorum]